MCTIALGRARLEETGLQGYGPLSGAWGRVQEGWLRDCFFQFSFSKAEEDHAGPSPACPEQLDAPSLRVCSSPWPWSGLPTHGHHQTPLFTIGKWGCGPSGWPGLSVPPKRLGYRLGYSQQDDRVPNQSRGSHPKPPQHHDPQELWGHSRTELSCHWGSPHVSGGTSRPHEAPRAHLVALFPVLNGE